MAKKHEEYWFSRPYTATEYPNEFTPEQERVMADIYACPPILFTPEYSKWRNYLRSKHPDKLDWLFESLPYEDQKNIYLLHREEFGALSNEAKGRFGERMTRNKTNDVSPYFAGGLGATLFAPLGIEYAALAADAAAPHIVNAATKVGNATSEAFDATIGKIADAFIDSPLGQKAIPFFYDYLKSPLEMAFAAQGLQNLASENGVAKTERLAREGEYGQAALSGLGDVLDASMVVPAAMGLQEARQSATDFLKYRYTRPPKHSYVTEKKAESSIDDLYKDDYYKSELDWSPESWFGRRVDKAYDAEDVAALRSHVPEYLQIEKTAKDKGTWLKMDDGSNWEGDPRSWVQMQSKSYDAYTGDSPFKYQPFSHSSNNAFQTFDLSFFGKTDEGFFGKGFYSHPAEKINGELTGRNSYGDKKYLLTTNVQKPLNLNSPEWQYAELFNRPQHNAPKGIFDKYDSVYFGVLGDNSIGAMPSELVVPKPTNYKSLLGNNGNFNPLNANMYKGLIPLLGIYGTASQKD